MCIRDSFGAWEFESLDTSAGSAGVIGKIDCIASAGFDGTATNGSVIRFLTSGTNSISLTERVRIDPIGNMGLGVTPNANWPSNGDFRALQVGTGACIFGRGSGDEDRGGIAVNYYSTGSGNKFLANGHASRIYMNDGRIDFNTTTAANSSGANAALTFTTPLSILANGRIGINDTSPSVTLETVGHNQVTFGSMPETIISYGTASAYNSGSAGGGIQFGGYYNSTPEYTIFAGVHGVKENTTNANYAGSLI